MSDKKLFRKKGGLQNRIFTTPFLQNWIYAVQYS